MTDTSHKTRVVERLLTIHEAAKRLTVSARTLRTLIAMDKLPVVRVSARRVAIHPADLDTYVSNCRQAR